MSDGQTTPTPFSNKVSILADLWLGYKKDSQFKDFFVYNDLGLPLAYSIDSGIVKESELAKTFIEETFDLLLAGLEAEDTGFESLEELLGIDE
jgi:hypothetical protein